MICELAYASAAEMTQFVTDLKALQDRWPNDFVRVLDDFDAIAYDIFVSKGVPFTEVVQFLQEFGSASETADVAHRLLIPNVKNDTPEEKSAERILRRDAMRRLVQFFNSLMSLLVNSAYHPAKKDGFEPLLVSADVAARLFSMTTEEFNSVAENRHIPAIRLGKDGATGHEIVRYHMETLKAFLSVSAKTSFLDRNSYIYQRNAMPKFPDEDEFRRRQETTGPAGTESPAWQPAAAGKQPEPSEAWRPAAEPAGRRPAPRPAEELRPENPADMEEESCRRHG